MTDEPAPALAPETKSFRGDFLLYRKGSRRPGRFRHQTFASAETEAARLLAMHPDSTIVIMQEVARVKLKPLPGDDHPRIAVDPNIVSGRHA